ncbi:MAG: glycoside hydrolase family 3 protein [Planctomycetota bacterium]|jgi:beta-N-acetylhexosaminidase
MKNAIFSSSQLARRQLILLLLTMATVLISLTTCKQPPADVSLDVKIGQMIMVGFRGLDVGDDSPVIRDIVERHIGGVILYDYDVPANTPIRNIKSPAQLKQLTAKLQAASDIPLFIAIDQEGGKVSRLKESAGFVPTLSARYLGSVNDLPLTCRQAARVAQTLAELGININLAPVVDLNVNRDNPIIGRLGRSFSADPEIVTAHAAEFIKAHHEYRVLCALKHFPGHGSSTQDSHLGLTDITKTWSSKELIPYENLIGQGLVDVIMTAHVYHGSLDPNFPATLSNPILTDLLRDQLFYDGVIISDCMQMRAITDHYGFETALQTAIKAGVDIILISNNSIFEEDAASRAIATIKSLIKEGKITPQRIDQSYRRIQKLKEKL